MELELNAATRLVATEGPNLYSGSEIDTSPSSSVLSPEAEDLSGLGVGTKDMTGNPSTYVQPSIPTLGSAQRLVEEN